MIKGRAVGTVAITGAGAGIGLAAAVYYAGKGWRVGLIGRGEAALEVASQRVQEAGGISHIARADGSQLSSYP